MYVLLIINNYNYNNSHTKHPTNQLKKIACKEIPGKYPEMM